MTDPFAPVARWTPQGYQVVSGGEPGEVPVPGATRIPDPDEFVVPDPGQPPRRPWTTARRAEWAKYLVDAGFATVDEVADDADPKMTKPDMMARADEGEAQAAQQQEDDDGDE